MLQKARRDKFGRLVDSKGRVKFTSHSQRPRRNVKLREYHNDILLFINLHGPQSSAMLNAINPRHKDTVSDHLALMYDAGYLFKPEPQRATEDPDKKLHVYDLTPKGIKYLQDEGLYVKTKRPVADKAATWAHQFMVASITACMDIMCRRSGYRYIPAHKLVPGPRTRKVSFTWTDGKTYTRDLCPDAIFGIDYGENTVIYMLEADRNNETNDSDEIDVKTDRRSLLQYQEFIGRKQYKEPADGPRPGYGLTDPAMLLYITVAEGHAVEFRELAKSITNGGAYYIAIGVADEFRKRFVPPHLKHEVTYYDNGVKQTHTIGLYSLFEEPLQRPGRDPYTIKKEASA